MLTPWKESYDQPRQHIKKQRHYFANKRPSNPMIRTRDIFERCYSAYHTDFAFVTLLAFELRGQRQ